MGDILGNNLYNHLGIKDRREKIMEITVGDWVIAWVLLVVGIMFVYILYKIMTASREEINGKGKKND